MIRLWPDPVLRGTAEPVDPSDPQVQAVATRMLELMREARGVGLAAPQVGLAWRLFVANATGEAEDDQVFINPVFTEATEAVDVHTEGCLSLPGIEAEIRRPVAITIEAQDLSGKRFTLTDEELPARIWQHEVDHLDGVLILDRMTEMDRLASRRALKDLESRYQSPAG
ncbi:MAG: peptide deformylase [Phycisphaerae bacterium]|nr:peptide deformylase [Phycisphaerae bacterium]